MKVYYEAIFVLNFLLDYMILYGTKKILKRNSKNIRLIFASFLGACSTFSLFFSISSFFLFFIKIFISIIMIFISFGFLDWLRNTFYFYMISILLGGVVYLLDLPNIPGITYILIVFISAFMIVICILEALHFHEKVVNTYEVSIYYQKKWYQISGFIDTGNQLLSPLKKESVILVDFELPLKKIIYVPYTTLNSSGVVPCIRPDKILVNQKEIHNCLVGISKNKIVVDGCRCILPNRLKEELC